MNFLSLITNPAILPLLRAVPVVPLVLPLIEKAESAFAKRNPEDKRGAEKKEFVMEAVQVIAQSLVKKGYLTKQMVEGIEPLAADIIDVIVDVNNILKAKGATA